jgi:hypothetical protein
MNSVKMHPLTIIRFLGLLLALFFLSTIAVDAKICLIGTVPDGVDSNELLSGYLDVAFNASFCSSAETKPEACPSSVARQKSNFVFGITGIELLSGEKVASFGKQIDLMNRAVKRATGFRGYSVPKEKHDSLIALTFIDQNEASEDQVRYVDSKLLWLNLGSTDTLTSLLSAFLSDTPSSCITINRENSHGDILVSSTWIKSHISQASLNQCVARAFVGGMGLNADQMFGPEELIGETSTGDHLYEIPSSYLTYLEIHYSELVKAGMTKNQIDVGRIQRELECKQ